MVRQGKWREPADLLVAGLALTDALLGVFVLWQTIYTLVYFQSVWECLFCVVVMATLYLKLFLVARKHAVAIAASVPGESTRQRTSEHAWRYTKTVLLIVGVNYLSWVPMGMVVIASLTGILGDMSIVKKGDLMLYTSCLVYGNSIINPAIYAIKIPAIHARYRALCCRWKTKHYRHLGMAIDNVLDKPCSL
nr:hypothetical protein BaRGS_004065 [Batillaria attramentaria]